MADKVKNASEVVRTIPDGSHIALGGFTIARNVIVVAHELIRQQKKNLTLSQCVITSHDIAQHVMAERGLNTSDKRLGRLIGKRVGACLRHQRDKGN